MSFKYGQGERADVNGRFFNDQNEDSLSQLLGVFSEVEVLEMWKTTNKRPGRSEGLWLNCLVKKLYRG
jgi:hypothetical protein